MCQLFLLVYPQQASGAQLDHLVHLFHAGIADVVLRRFLELEVQQGTDGGDMARLEKKACLLVEGEILSFDGFEVGRYIGHVAPGCAVKERETVIEDRSRRKVRARIIVYEVAKVSQVALSVAAQGIKDHQILIGGRPVARCHLLLHTQAGQVFSVYVDPFVLEDLIGVDEADIL